MASASTEGVDVNLTPLLDLVLQLIMFFMITIRLVHYERSNEEIDLPTTEVTLAKEDEKNRFPVWVNMTEDGTILGLYFKATRKDVEAGLATKEGELKTLAAKVPLKLNLDDKVYQDDRKDVIEKITRYFTTKRQDYDNQARAMGMTAGGWKVGVVIRADKRCRYERVWTLMDIVQSANFDFWQVSVLNKAG